MDTRVVLFDVYGTLACWPPGRMLPIDVQRLLDRFGVRISYQAFEAARQSVMFLDGTKRPIEGWTDFLALVFARMGVSLSIDLLTSVAAEYESRHRMQLHPEASSSVQAVKATGRVLGAFTTLPRFMFAHGGGGVLRELDHYFDAALVGHAKGHPDFYHRITELLGVEPAEILCVGDDPTCDVELPAAAGWRAVLLDRETTGDTKQAGRFRVIHSLGDLVGLIED